MTTASVGSAARPSKLVASVLIAGLTSLVACRVEREARDAAAEQLGCARNEISVTEALSEQRRRVGAPPQAYAVGCGKRVLMVEMCPPGTSPGASSCTWTQAHKLKREALIRRASFDLSCDHNLVRTAHGGTLATSMEWHEWQRLVAGSVRRLEREADGLRQAEALAIARKFLALFDRAKLARSDLAPLLSESARLPARSVAAVNLRKSLLRCYLSIDDAHFDPPQVTPKQLVIDPYGELVLITAVESTPAAEWLARQDFLAARTVTESDWWKGLTFNGGAKLVPAPLVFAVGQPSRDHLMELVEHGSARTAQTILALFPKLREELPRS